MKCAWLVMFLLLAGCQDAAPPAEPPPADSSGQTKAQSTNEETAKPEPPPDPDYVLERIHQLKDMPTEAIQIGPAKFKAFLALTESSRAEGMMFLQEKHVKESEGMLFVFSDEAPRRFWMQNVKFDLDLAYISKSGKIVSTHHLVAQTEQPVPGKGPSMYVLEMKRGEFQRLGIKEGMIAKIPAGVKSED